MKLGFLRLAGLYQERDEVPTACPECSCKHFYKQTDFRRSWGIALVFSASAATCVLFFQGQNWFLVWSPMLIALVVDRTLSITSPKVAVCYECGLIFRKLKSSELEKISGFDLDLHDRILYPKRTGEDLPEQPELH